MSESIFSEDNFVCQAAERFGMELQRQRPVVITDKKAIKEAGLMRETPDYPRIKKLLLDGAEVPGACFGRMEYVLRVPSVKAGEAE